MLNNVVILSTDYSELLPFFNKEEDRLREIIFIEGQCRSLHKPSQ